MPVTDLTVPGTSLSSIPGWRTGTIDPSQLQGAQDAPWWQSLLGNMNPWAKAAMAAGAVMQPAPTASNDTISPEMAGQRPQQPPSTGMMPALPPTTLPSGMPGGVQIVDRTQPPPNGALAAPPAQPMPMPKDVPLPPVRPKFKTSTPKGHPAPTPAPSTNGNRSTDLPAPNSDPLARNRPRMTALDLSGLFGRST